MEASCPCLRPRTPSPTLALRMGDWIRESRVLWKQCARVPIQWQTELGLCFPGTPRRHHVLPQTRVRMASPVADASRRRREKRRLLDARRSKCRIRLGGHMEQWCLLKERLGFSLHSQLAKFLLDRLGAWRDWGGHRGRERPICSYSHGFHA